MLNSSVTLTAEQQEIVTALQEVYDPELPVNIYDLGLIYGIVVGHPKKIVDITMTLTTPSCPAAELLPKLVQEAVTKINWVKEVNIKITFDPPYTPEKMSEDARLALGWHD